MEFSSELWFVRNGLNRYGPSSVPSKFLKIFRASFTGKQRPLKTYYNPRHFSLQNPQANVKKRFTEFLLRAGKVTINPNNSSFPQNGYAGSGLPQGPFLENNLFPLKVGLSHRVLQGAAQKGAQFYFIIAVLRTLFSCSEMSLFSLKTCTPPEGTPLKHSLFKMGFCQWAEMGPKVGFWVHKWVQSGSKPTVHPL